MAEDTIYMDNHATTRVDPRVIEVMLPFFSEAFGNPASTSHRFGWEAQEAVKAARKTIAQGVGARPKEIVFTSGATESNNLAIRGVVDRPPHQGKHLISVGTEHRAVLDPLSKLAARGYKTTFLPVVQAPHDRAGLISPEQVAEAIRDETVLVSVMLANNEIGVIQPLEAICRVCRERNVLVHTDATQAVGKIPVDVEQLGVDLMSFSAHKMYGPKGIGALYVRRKPPVRLEPLIHGGGHEGGLRSGTANVPGIVGFARAMELSLAELAEEAHRLRALRDRLYQGLREGLPGVKLNGPTLERPELRLAGNLNVSFANIDGESLLMSTQNVAASSGSACTSSRPEPSHVLRGLGLSEGVTRGSVRFGLGRFNTPDEVESAIAALTDSITRLRRMSSLPVLPSDD